MSNGMNISFTIQAIDSFSSIFSSVESQTHSLESTVSGISDKLAGIGKGLVMGGTGMLAASSAALGIGLNYLAGMQSAETGLNTLTGSADKTKSIMKDLQTFAIKTPFDFPGMLAGERRLMGMGFAADEATGMLKSTADAVAATGGGQAELDGVITALGQIKAKGKISAEEMNQLAERGIPAWALLSKELGKTPAQLMKMASDGKLLAKDALPALQKGFETTFGGSAAKQADTFSGRLANMKENFAIFAGALAKPLFEPLSNAMGVINEKAQAFAQWFQSLPQPVQTFATAAMLLVPILIIMGGLFLMFVAFIPAIAAGFAALPAIFGAIGAALTGVVAPIALAIAAVVGIGIALVAAYNHVAWFRDGVNVAWEWIKNAFSISLNFILGIVKSVMSAVSAFIGDQLKQITAWWSQNGTAVIGVVKVAWAIIVGILRVAMGLIQLVFQTVWPIIVGIITVAWALIKMVISTAITLILGIIGFFAKIFTGDISGAMETAKNTFKTILANIVQIFKNVNFAEIGRNIVQGLINGIKSMAGQVGKAVAGIASAIPAKIKSFLGIHSPSRVMMELGGYTGEGFAIGLGDQLSQIKSASRDMATAAIPNVKGVQPATYQPTATQAQSSPINLTLHYHGSGTQEDASNMIDIVSRGISDRLGTKLRLNGVR